VLLDTDVLIWYSRGNENAVEFINHLDTFSISVITYMEIVQGLRNKKEKQAFNQLISIFHIKVIQIDELISFKAMLYVDKYALSHSMQLADALIAATAVHRQLKLVSGNTKHYQYISDIALEAFKV